MPYLYGRQALNRRWNWLAAVGSCQKSALGRIRKVWTNIVFRSNDSNKLKLENTLKNLLLRLVQQYQTYWTITQQTGLAVHNVYGSIWSDSTRTNQQWRPWRLPPPRSTIKKLLYNNISVYYPRLTILILYYKLWVNQVVDFLLVSRLHRYF